MVRSMRMRWLVWGLTAAVVIILAALAWVGARALMAKKELDAVTSQVDALRQAVADQDLARLESIAKAAGPHIQAATDLTGDPIWRATEVLPVLGPNLTTARVVSASLDTLVNDLALPLTSRLPHLGEADGGINVRTLQDIAQTLTEAGAALQTSQHELHALDLHAVLAPIADGAQQLQKITDQVTPIVRGTAPFLHIAPGLLGADSTRHILLIVQNNAELRTGGGISGSFVELTAQKGRVSLSSVASDALFPPAAKPVTEVPASTTKLYGDVVGRYVQNTTSPADFTLTARLASAWWHTHTGETPDAVLSIDPYVLTALLQATGPVKVQGATLSADNAIEALLVAPYLTMDSAEQDVFFEAVAKSVFQRVVDGSTSASALAWALQKPLAEGRISAWSSVPEEQRVLGRAPLGGPAVRHAAAGAQAYAVYLSDATGSKMDRFLQTAITTGSTLCRDDGHRDVVVTVTLHSQAPANAGSVFPVSVTGGGIFGTRAGDIRTIVSVAAPAGTFFGGVRADGKLTTSPDVVDAGFPTSATTVLLAPGQTKTVEFRFIAAQAGAVQPVILHTPMINAPKISSTAAECR